MSGTVMKHATDVKPFAGLDVTVPDEIRSRIDLVLGLRHHWANTIFATLRSHYDAAVAELPVKPRTGEEARPIVERLPIYATFGWFERNVQKMMWRALTEACEADREQLVAALNTPVTAPVGSLELDP